MSGMPIAKNALPDAAQVAAALEEAIALGILAPRERLVEEDLVARFGVKRHVVRQALSQLDSMGIIDRQPNRGAAVKYFSPDEVEQIFEARVLVETAAARKMPLPPSPELVATLQAIHKRHCAAVARGDLPAVFRENLNFHRTLFAGCGNVHLSEAIEQLAFKAHAIRSYSIADPKLLANALAEHGQIIELMQKGKRQQLVRLVGSHILPAKNAYLRFSRGRQAAGALAGPRDARRPMRLVKR
jgi:DNA-binding GntR family transcriptional regulator